MNMIELNIIIEYVGTYLVLVSHKEINIGVPEMIKILL